MFSSNKTMERNKTSTEIRNMRTSDIVMIFRFKDADNLLERFMHYNLRHCNCFIAMDDRSTSDSCYNELKEHEKCAGIILKKSDCHFSEICDRESLYSLAITTGKTFALYLDADEILDESFTDEISTVPDSEYYSANMLTLYPDECHYITHGIYANHKTTILAKLSDRHYDLSDINRLHLSRFPAKPGRNVYSLSSKIYHFSLCSSDRIKQRYEFYKSHDPDSVYQKRGYDHLLRKYKFAPLNKKWEI